MNRKQEALELMRKYPEQTLGLAWEEVAEKWEEYSDTMAAGWLIPDEQAVTQVFNYRESDSKYSPDYDDYNGWKYIAVEDDGLFYIAEHHGKFGFTNAITPNGDSIEELVHDLETMLEDIKNNNDLPDKLEI